MPTAPLPRDEIERWAAAPLPALMAEAARLRDLGHGDIVSYSRKVFIPLTQLCRDVCHYCTFARGPRAVDAAYLSPDEVLAIARAGAAAGCKEALFTLGDKPELRYARGARGARPARLRDDARYLAAMCALVLRETGLLPHVNPGVMTRDDIAALRARVGVAGHDAGERVASGCASAAGRISARPTRSRRCGSRRSRRPARLQVPFTTGILIGIGETRARAHRGAARDSRPARALRPHPGNHRPEFPRQAATRAWRDAPEPDARRACSGPSRWRG